MVIEIISRSAKNGNFAFLRDYHWYFAFLIAIVMWLIYGLLITPLTFNSLFGFTNIFLFSVFLYPIVEEIVFRGVIQDFFNKQEMFKKGVLGLSWANIMTSVIFALGHLINQSVFFALLTFFPSLIFGYFKDRHQVLLPGILLHIFYNAGFFILIMK